MTESLQDLRYPIGRFAAPPEVTAARVDGWIAEIERLPGELRRVVEPLSPEQLETRYRPGGWTIRQVVHHVPESHLNSYIRFKWALTEERPLIKAYYEERWAELADVAEAPVGVSLDLLDALHRRWVVLLRALGPEDLLHRRRRRFRSMSSDMKPIEARLDRPWAGVLGTSVSVYLSLAGSCNQFRSA